MSENSLFEKIKAISRRNYIRQITPLQKLTNLSKALGGEVEIYMKRDDLLPFGGNKTRKLEFLFQEAVDLSADTIITASTVQCNHNLMALLMANMEGMKTELILENWAKSDYEYALDPNKHLYEFGGVSRTVSCGAPVTGPLHTMELALKMKADLEAQGKKPYLLARGGTCPLGNCGYILCAEELLGQGKEMNLDFDYVVCPSGTGGTQAGLIIGLEQAGCAASVIGINVAQKNDRQLNAVYAALEGTASLLNIEAPHKDKVICYEEYVGEGYSRPTAELKEAIELLARTEGIMLDPVYSGKALAGLIGLIRNGAIKKGSRLVFLHTGGSTPYYDYSSMAEML
ncbi:MAG TPA: D-cysteine desulfhydrase family protein [Anaerovoracaceae bacterium]|nr:D-cysteine desulfhydrase family protein [Anaerovoracaceae bacterium]